MNYNNLNPENKIYKIIVIVDEKGKLITIYTNILKYSLQRHHQLFNIIFNACNK